jgi:hypothetical protein
MERNIDVSNVRRLSRSSDIQRHLMWRLPARDYEPTIKV